MDLQRNQGRFWLAHPLLVREQLQAHRDDLLNPSVWIQAIAITPHPELSHLSQLPFSFQQRAVINILSLHMVLLRSLNANGAIWQDEPHQLHTMQV